MKFYQLVGVQHGWDEETGFLFGNTTFVGYYATRQQVIEEVRSQMTAYRLFIVDSHVPLDDATEKFAYEEECEFYGEKVDSNTFLNEAFEEDSEVFTTVGEIGYNSMEDPAAKDMRCEFVEFKVLIVNFEN